MTFIFIRFFQALILPPAIIIIFLLIGIFVMHRRPRTGKSITGLAVVLLYFLSLPAAADLLIRPLESAYQPFTKTTAKADAVVVLGGGVANLSWLPSPPLPSETSLVRTIEGIILAKQLHLPLIFSGGSGELADIQAKEADAMAALAARLGFPREKIIVERSSRNTMENAQEVRKIVTGRTIVLVTSAFHMKRAAAIFQKHGFFVLPAPAGYRAQTRPASGANLLPRAIHLETSSLALSEYLSFLYYRLTGRL